MFTTSTAAYCSDDARQLLLGAAAAVGAVLVVQAPMPAHKGFETPSRSISHWLASALHAQQVHKWMSAEQQRE